MNIQITPKKSDGVERLLEISVPVETVRDAEERAARRYASSVRLPGFRPGKAPPAMVKKRFAQAIRQEALEALVQDAYKEAMEREKLEPVTQPHIHDLKFDEGAPLTFELHVEVRPHLELGRTGGFRVSRPPTEVTDEMVAEQLEQLREQRASWTPVEERPAPGDMVTVLLATADESGAIPEGKEYRLTIGGGQAIPGIEELIMEAAPGRAVERPVKWPDDFPDETQRGQTKTARVELQDVKRKSLPDLDDAFAREVGDFDSLEALRTAVRADLTNHLAREAESEVRQKLLDEILTANAFDVPRSWVQRMMSAYAEAYQIPEDERERFAEQFQSMAERQVRRDMVIDAVAQKEGLGATEADIDDRIAEVAMQRGKEPGEVYASLQKAGRIAEIERSITEEKVFQHLMAQSVVE